MKCEIYRDHFQNFKQYQIPKAQLIIADVPYNLGDKAYASNPTQKPVPLLMRLIEIFTDEGDVVIDPCCGSGTSLLAAANLKRDAYGFEIKKKFYDDAKNKVLRVIEHGLF